MNIGREVERAPAKVNLFLRVTGRRADGYHLLDSVVVFADIADRIEFAPSDGLTLTITGPFSASLTNESDNLVMRAARALAAESGVPATGALTLEKHIPVASGIGGGSSDAAATLRMLCRVWRLRPEPSVLHRVALGLGADVPVCLSHRPQRMRGVGEVLSLAPAMPSCGLLLVNPGMALATAVVFRARSGRFSDAAEPPESWDTARSLAASLAEWPNDLEAPAISLVPAIREVLHAIRNTRGCLLARMSGSGATCFGLFGTAREAADAAVELTRPGWWSWGGSLAR